MGLRHISAPVRALVARAWHMRGLRDDLHAAEAEGDWQEIEAAWRRLRRAEIEQWLEGRG